YFKPIRLDRKPPGASTRSRWIFGEWSMLRSELVAKLQEEFAPMKAQDVEHAVDIVLDEIATALAGEGPVELRGFAACAGRKRGARYGRNPRTGGAVKVSAKRVPVFKPGKELRLKVNGGEEP